MSNESLKTESAWLLAGLYQGGLFIGNEPVEPVDRNLGIHQEQTTASESINTNQQNSQTEFSEALPQFEAKFIHWVAEDSDFDYKDMISKIMFALKWNGQEIKADDFIFLNSNEMQYSFDELFNAGSFKAERILVWSNNFKDTRNGQILNVASPSAVAVDKETKIKYWNQIKSYFGL